MSNTIKLKSYLDIENEETAAEAITPGALCEITSGDEIQNHSTAQGVAAPIVALEDELQGKTIADNYASTDKVKAWYVAPGEEVLVLITGATNIGDYLESVGDGTVQTVTTGSAIFQAIGDQQTDDSNNTRVPARRV